MKKYFFSEAFEQLGVLDTKRALSAVPRSRIVFLITGDIELTIRLFYP